MFLHIEFKNGSNPYVFYGKINAVEKDLGDWKKYWDIHIQKETPDGIFAVAEERAERMYCDRNLCLQNEYNGIGCDKCVVMQGKEHV